MLNFGELKTKVSELAQWSDSSDYKTKIGVWLNLAHRILAQSYDYYTELQKTHNFTTVADQEDYPLPNIFSKPFRLYDLTDNIHLKFDTTEEEYFDGHIEAIADADTGSPNTPRIYGTTPVTTQVASTGDTLQVKSSSSSDTGGIIVRVEGYVDSSKLIIDYEEITVSTSSPTTYVSGTKTFYEITHLSKSENTTGYVTLADSSSNVLGYLPANERISSLKILKLGLIPDSANSMRLLYKAKTREMVSDYDYPFIDADNYLILEAWAWAVSQDKEMIGRALTIWNKAKEALYRLIADQNTKLGPEHQKKIDSVWSKSHRR